MIDPKQVNIGDTLIHQDKGEIIVEGIMSHCGDYAIHIKDGWVYLSKCLYPTPKNK